MPSTPPPGVIAVEVRSSDVRLQDEQRAEAARDPLPPQREVTHRLGPTEGKKSRGRGRRTGFRNTYDFEVLMADAVEMIKAHLPQIEQWQAEELAFDLQVGTRESGYWIQR